MPVATPHRDRMDADLPPLPPPTVSSRHPRTVTFANDLMDYAGEHRKVEKSIRKQERRARERAIEEREAQLERLEARWDGYYAPPRDGEPFSARDPPQHARTPHPSPMVSTADISPYSPMRPVAQFPSTSNQGMQPRRVSAPPDGPSVYHPRYTPAYLPNEYDRLASPYRPVSSSGRSHEHMPTAPHQHIPARPATSPSSDRSDRIPSHLDSRHPSSSRPPATQTSVSSRASPRYEHSIRHSPDYQPFHSGIGRNRRVSEPLVSRGAASPASRLLPVSQNQQETTPSSGRHLETSSRHQEPSQFGKRLHVPPQLQTPGNSDTANESRVFQNHDKKERRKSQPSQHSNHAPQALEGPAAVEDTKSRPSKQRSVSTPTETVVQAIKDQSTSVGLHMTLDEMEEDVTCSICLQVIVAAHGMSPCGHTICGGCANEWVREKSTCPACRTALTKDAPFVPLLGMDAIISKWVRKQGENWEGLQDWQERCEMWQAHRAFNAQSPAPVQSQDTALEEDDPYRNWIHQDFGQLSFEPHPQPSFSGSFVDRHDRAMFDLLTGSRPSERVMREMLFPSSFAIEAVRDILHDSTRDRFRDRFRHAALRFHRQLS